MRKRGIEYETTVGQIISIKPNGENLRANRLTTRFYLGCSKAEAIKKEIAIREEWEKCKQYGDSCWKTESIQSLVDGGIIDQEQADKVTKSITCGIGSAIQATPEIYGKIRKHINPKQLKNAEDFGKWLIIVMTEKMQTRKFKKQLGEALDALAERDPIGAARTWLDFSERIMKDNTIVQQNITGVTVFGSKGKYVPEPIDVESREIINETNESSENSESIEKAD